MTALGPRATRERCGGIPEGGGPGFGGQLAGSVVRQDRPFPLRPD